MLPKAKHSPAVGDGWTGNRRRSSGTVAAALSKAREGKSDGGSSCLRHWGLGFDAKTDG